MGQVHRMQPKKGKVDGKISSVRPSVFFQKAWIKISSKLVSSFRTRPCAIKPVVSWIVCESCKILTRRTEYVLTLKALPAYFRLG
jgi:hypothetical protein